MQMNVVSNEVQIAARMSSELYPNILVRVCFFLGHFKDLLEGHKDLLIFRVSLISPYTTNTEHIHSVALLCQNNGIH